MRFDHQSNITVTALTKLMQESKSKSTRSLISLLAN